MVLADDDFGVYTEFARAAQDFDDAARGSGAAPRIANQLDVDDGAIEFRKTRNAPPAEAAFIDPAESEFLGEAWRQFMPWGNFHLVLHTSVVRQHDVSARAIAKQTNEGGMRAVQDSQDAALGALRARYTAAPLNLHQDVVSVHGVLDGVSSDIHIAIELGYRDVRHYKAIAVGMEDQPALEFISIDRKRLQALRRG